MRDNGRVVRLAVVGVLMAGATATLTSPAAGRSPDPSGDGIRVVGKLPVFSPPDRLQDGGNGNVIDVDLLLSPTRRRGYQIFNSAPLGPTVRSFDLDTFRPLGTAKGLPFYIAPTGGGNYLTEQWNLLDERKKRLYVAAQPPGRGTPLFGHEILVFDLDRVDAGRDDALIAAIKTPVEMPELENALIKGMHLFDDESGREKMLIYYMRSPPPSLIVQFDVERAIDASRSGVRQGYGDWRYVLAGNCHGTTLTLATKVPIFRAKHGPYIYTVCHVGKAFVNAIPAVQGGFTLAVVRIPLGVGGLPRADQEEVFPGPSFVHAAMADPDADRISMVSETTSSGAGTGKTVWVFDGRASRFVGAVGITAGQGGAGSTYGIDEETGRVYALVPHQRLRRSAVEDRWFTVAGGLQVIDARLTPVPQSLSFPELARSAWPAIRVDPAAEGRPRRIFFRYATQVEALTGQGAPPPICEFRHPSEGTQAQTDARDCYQDDPFYLVVEERIPIPRRESVSDRDRFTIDVPEHEGVTGSNFEGAASAYAARARFVGGFREGPATACAPDEREYTLGWVDGTRVSNVEVAARAIGLGADETSRLDLERPAQRCSRNSGSPYKEFDQAAGTTYPVEHAECAGVGTDARKTAIANGHAAAEVVCEQLADRVSATASVRGFDATNVESPPGLPPIRIADATSTIETYRDPARGIVVRAEAVVRGIEVPLPEGSGAPLRISLAKSVVESWSNGRPAAGSRVSYERIVCGVGVASVADGACYKSQDDPQLRSLIEDVTRRSGGRITVRVPDPDPELKRGSPGGYIAGVQKSSADQIDDKLLNGDASLEVPAIELVRYADTDDAKIRQIVRLAGVRATTTYGIYLLPRFGGALPPSGPGPDGGMALPDPGSQLRTPDASGAPTPSGPAGFRLVPGKGPVIFGLRVRPLGETALGAAVWLALALPFYLAWRREWLIRWFGKEAG